MFVLNQDANSRRGLVSPDPELSCEGNFEQFDPCSIRFVGAGTFGAVFLMTWFVHGNRVAPKQIVMKIQFFESQREMSDESSIVYSETYVHARASRLLESGAASAFTKLIGYFRCEYPFGTRFAVGISAALRNAASVGAERFISTLLLRGLHYRALRRGDADSLRRLDLPLGASVRDRAHVLQAQYVLSEYGGDSLFSVLASHRLSYTEQGSLSSGRWLLAVLFQVPISRLVGELTLRVQVFFSLRIAAREFGMVHIDLSLLNLLYGAFDSQGKAYENAARAGRGMRFVLEDRRWFIRWSDACDPQQKQPQQIEQQQQQQQQPMAMLTRIIDFGNATAGHEAEPSREVMGGFEQTFRWPRMRHAASYGTRRLVQTLLDVIQSRRVPYAELLQADRRRLATLLTSSPGVDLRALDDEALGALVRRCASALETVWPIMYRASGEWERRRSAFESLVHVALEEISRSLLNADQKRRVWELIVNRWAAPMVRDGLWASRAADLSSLRRLMLSAHRSANDLEWVRSVDERLIERLALVLGTRAYLRFPPASYYNPLVREDAARLECFVDDAWKVFSVALLKRDDERLRRVALGRGGVIDAARCWLERRVVQGRWEGGYGKMHVVHEGVSGVVDWLDLQYRLDEVSGSWHASHAAAALPGLLLLQQQEDNYAEALFRGALELSGKPFETTGRPSLLFDRFEESRARTLESEPFDGPLYGVSHIHSPSIKEGAAFSKQYRVCRDTARLVHAFKPSASSAALISWKQLERLSRHEPFSRRGGLVDAVDSRTRRLYRRLARRRSFERARTVSDR